MLNSTDCAALVACTSTRTGNRHTFVHERLLELVEHETARCGGASFTKRDLARAFECSERSVSRAVTRLRREGKIETIPRYADDGSQVASLYRALTVQ